MTDDLTDRVRRIWSPDSTVSFQEALASVLEESSDDAEREPPSQVESTSAP